MNLILCVIMTGCSFTGDMVANTAKGGTTTTISAPTDAGPYGDLSQIDTLRWLP